MRDPSAITGKEREAILSARALVLAEEAVIESETAGLEVLEFRLGPEVYGLESTYVREVYRLKEFTPLPGTPPFVLGITSVRGEVLSIMDLRRFLGLPVVDETGLYLVIIVRSGDMQVAIVVDEIVGVLTIRPGAIQATLPTLTGGNTPYLRGVIGDRVSLLDIAKLLADPRIIVDMEIDD